MAKTYEEMMKEHADAMADLVLKNKKPGYYAKWELKTNGKHTNQYIAVVVFKVDKNIFDNENPYTKNRGRVAQQGSIMASTKQCPCCNGSGRVSN